ncbi:hypothetical protein, partial [Bacillus thermotolerans]
SDCRQTRWKSSVYSLFILPVNGVVDFHSRRFAFRGAGGEPPQAALCGVSPVPLIPQESARLPFQSTEIIKFV